MADLTPQDYALLKEGADKAKMSIEEFAISVEKSSGSVQNYIRKIRTEAVDLAQIAGKSFEQLNNLIVAAGDKLSATGDEGAKAQLQLFGLATAAFKAKESFAGLGGVDYGNMNTFTSQIGQMKEMLSMGGTAMESATGTLKNMFAGFKDSLPLSTFNKIMNGSTDAMVKFLENAAQKSDNMMRLQGSILASASATGTLSSVFEKAGPHLENINDVLLEHQTAMNKTIAATGAAPEAVEKYYMALSRVPGALEATVSSGAAAGGSMNMLTAVMKMATGNGRMTESVMKDMGDAFKNFGMKGESALVFVNKFSELSNNLGVEFDDMKSALSGAANAFKDIGDAGKNQQGIIDGLTNMMNKYTFALKEAGMTGKHASEVVAGMAEGMSKMSVAQRAFLSAQTGGPGGLLGGLQIQKMLRDNDIAGVQKKVMETMQKQIGPITTMDEALQGGQAGASRNFRQQQMLMTGPLASALGIKGEMDAQKMLEAMKAMQEGRSAPKDLKTGPAGLQDAMNKGTDIQKQSYTELTRINAGIDAVKRHTDFLASGFSTTNFGVAPGKNAALTELQQKRINEMERASKEGGDNAQDFGTQMNTPGPMKELGDQRRKEVVDNMTKMLEGYSDYVKEKLAPLTQAAGNKDNMMSERSKILKDIQARSQSEGYSKEMAQKDANVKTYMDKIMSSYDTQMSQPTAPKLPSVGSFTRKYKDGSLPLTPAQAMAGEAKKVAAATTSPGKQLAAAPKAPTTTRKADEGAPAVPHTVTVQKAGPDGMKINVNVQVDQASENARASNAPGGTH